MSLERVTRFTRLYSPNPKKAEEGDAIVDDQTPRETASPEVKVESMTCERVPSLLHSMQLVNPESETEAQQ
jgi:hypothetical protein